MKQKVVVAIIAMVCLTLCSCSSTTETTSKGSNTPTTETETRDKVADETEAGEDIVGVEIAETIPEIESDNFEEKLVSFGFTEDEAAENAEILRQCGIPTIDICEPTTSNSLDSVVAFRGQLDDDRTFWFTVDNRKIFYVSLNGEDLYNADKGGYLKDFNDVHIPEKSVTTDVYNTLREKTEPLLDKYFSSARYYDAWAIAREDDNYMMYCQASDGSLSTDYWYSCRVWYERQENGDFTTTGVQINGKYYEVNE